jgi:colanic acid biosynthesis glycosyl transferase WcaI
MGRLTQAVDKLEDLSVNKIVFVNRYYRPDHSATAQLLTDLAEHMAANGAQISVVCSRQCYENASQQLPAREQLAGVEIHRVWTTTFGRNNLLGRSLDYFSFYLTCFFRLLLEVKRGDLLVVKTDPPMISVVGALVAKMKGAELVNWLQDLFPEVARELGIGIMRTPVYGLLRWLRNWSLKVARNNVVLGDLMAERVNRNVIGSNKTVIIPNWIINNNLRPIPAEENLLRREWHLAKKFVVGYSGNLGRAHDYKTFFQAALALRSSKNIVFVFVGAGAGLVELKNLVAAEDLGNVFFRPYQSMSLLDQCLSAPDIHLVSLEPQLEGLIVPSKLYGILAVGRPILFVGAHDGEIARIIDSHHCGVTIAPGDWQALAIQIQSLATSGDRLTKLSQNSYRLFATEFADGKSIQRWKTVLAISHDS